MNILKKSDIDLAALYNECLDEMRRRFKAASCDDLALIRGNECAKRALTVALAGNHSILFIGPPNSGKTMLRAAAIHYIGPVTFEARPCPCGYLGSPLVACECSDATINRHRAKLPVADITIEVVPPLQRELNARPGTGSAEISAVLTDLPTYTDIALCEVCQNLLRCACTELSIDAKARERIIAVARTIANLDRSKRIQPAHLTEAINYRAFFRYHRPL